MMMKYICVAGGGMIGAICRLMLLELFRDSWKAHAMWGTLCANFIGCFLAGLTFAGLERLHLQNSLWTYGLTIGFLGALTTFSTFCLEAFFFIKDGQLKMALAYAMGSTCCGIMLAYAGYKCLESTS